jgi:hypothetical protein
MESQLHAFGGKPSAIGHVSNERAEVRFSAISPDDRQWDIPSATEKADVFGRIWDPDLHTS